jgi:hypothetical protein
MLRPRKSAPIVERVDIDDARQRELRRARQTFEQRERQRLGLSPRTQEPVRKAPAMADDRELKNLISRGFSEATARAMLEGRAPTPYRYVGHSGWPPEF